jgi:hypothetical protein
MIIWEVFPTNDGWSLWFATRKEAMTYLREGYPEIQRTGRDDNITWFASEDREYVDLGMTRHVIARGRAGLIAFLIEREES